MRLAAGNYENVTPLRNPICEALTKGQFCYMVEVVASLRSSEAQLRDFASRLTEIPGVVGGSVTNFAGGAPGQDPLRIGSVIREQGLTPNVHLTCVRNDRKGLRNILENLRALAIENVFAMTGDFPKSDPATAIFDLDSVQLVHLIDELRQGGFAYWIAVAVSPFKYRESDCVYQYLKLRKKIAAGADYAITQLGYDVGKFRELKRYLDENVGPFPVLGNVYILNTRAAEKMGNGAIPGCWVSPKLRSVVRAESEGPDKGLLARLERAARMAAVLRGLGYAGAYLGGTQNVSDVRWIIDRAKQLRPRWEELAEELSFAPERSFYLYKSRTRDSVNREIVPRILDALANLFPLKRGNLFRRLLAKIFDWIDRKPPLAQGVERIEYAVKSPLFGCKACGNCVLSYTEYVCPETCPKQMRNGPCGGANNDSECEVVQKPCIWGATYERAKAAHKIRHLETYVPPPNRSLKYTSSWINYFLDRDSRPGAATPPENRAGPSQHRPGEESSTKGSTFVSLNTELGRK